MRSARTARTSRTEVDGLLVELADYALEGLEGAITRGRAYADAGADVLLMEAFTALADYRRAAEELDAPVLANATEFGVTPLFGLDEFRDAGVAAVLYPLSAARVASHAAEHAFRTIRSEGTQRALVADMQTRDELYDVLDYLRYERALDELNRDDA